MIRCIPVEGSPGFNYGGDDILVTLDERNARIETPNVLVQCHGFLCFRFGYPNDEALSADPLFGFGLKYHDVVQVVESPWLQQINQRNLVNFPNFCGFKAKHYFMSFRDSSFEVLCDYLTFHHPWQPEFFTKVTRYFRSLINQKGNGQKVSNLSCR